MWGSTPPNYKKGNQLYSTAAFLKLSCNRPLRNSCMKLVHDRRQKYAELCSPGIAGTSRHHEDVILCCRSWQQQMQKLTKCARCVDAKKMWPARPSLLLGGPTSGDH